MPNFKVRNYRGIKSADISLDKLTLITGLNASGKTSTIEAIMCAATGQPNPFKEITKKQASMLVHSGTASGSVEYIDGENVSKIQYPSMEYSSQKQPVLISDIAAGIVSMVDMNLSERINFVVKMTDAEPKIADLMDELKKVELVSEDTTDPMKNELVAKLWEQIEINGWDNTAKQAREKGAKLKGVWEDTTGEKKYGKRIAESWIPAGWSAELESIGEEKLIKIVADCKEWYEAAIKETAISDFEQDKLQIEVDKIPDLEKRIFSCEESIKECNENLRLIQSNITEKSRSENPVLVCPACKEKLDIENGELVKSDRKPKVASDVSGLKSELDGWNKQKQTAVENYGALKSKLSTALDAKSNLEEIQSTAPATVSLEDCKNNLEIANVNLEAYQSYKKAHKAHRNIETNEKLVAILEPKGLRNKKLTDAFKQMNDYLKSLCDSVGWSAVEFTEDCEILCGGVPYGRFLAKSERYRVKVCVLRLVMINL